MFTQPGVCILFMMVNVQCLVTPVHVQCLAAHQRLSGRVNARSHKCARALSEIRAWALQTRYSMQIFCAIQAVIYHGSSVCLGQPSLKIGIDNLGL